MVIQRPRFYAPDPIPRRTQAQQQAKNEITLSQKTIGNLLRVETADKNDLP